MRLSSRYRIKDSVSLFAREERSGYTLEFLFSSSRKVVTFGTDNTTFELIRLCDGTKSGKEIASSLGVEPGEVQGVLRMLLKEGILEPLKDEVREEGRYRRQINFFTEFETGRTSRFDFQERLVGSRVLVLGLGGIGSWVARSLAQAGVGALVLIDPDVVSETNVTHQAAYSLTDVGESKVSVLSRELQTLNKDLHLTPVVREISSPEELEKYLPGVSVAVNCADYPGTDETNDLVSRACFVSSIPHVLCGGYDGHVTSIGQTVIPGKSSCWRCFVESGAYEKLMRGFSHVPTSRAHHEGGTIAPIAAISGNIQALEVLRLLTGYQKPFMLNKRGEFDFTKYTLSTRSVPRLKGCTLCGEKKGAGK